MVDMMLIKDFVEAATRKSIVSELRLADGESPTVYGKEAAGAVDLRVR